MPSTPTAFLPSRTRVPMPSHPFWKMSRIERKFWVSAWDQGMLRLPSTVGPLFSPRPAVGPLIVCPVSTGAEEAVEIAGTLRVPCEQVRLGLPVFSAKLLPNHSDLQDGTMVYFRNVTITVKKMGEGNTGMFYEYLGN